MNTSNTSLPNGTLTSDLDFSDDLAGVNERIAFHEARLNLVQSEPTEDIARANLLLFALASSRSSGEAEEQVRACTGLWYDVTRQTAANPVSAAVTPSSVASTPPPSSVLPALVASTTVAPPDPQATGYRRLARVFAANQSVSLPATTIPSGTSPVGTLRLAAYYAHHSKTIPAN